MSIFHQPGKPGTSFFSQVVAKKIANLSEKMSEISTQNDNLLLQIPRFRGQTDFAQEIFKVT